MNPFKLTRDARGNLRRQNLGRKLADDGTEVKPATFTLGKDYQAACERSVLLGKMWDAIEKDWQKDRKTACPLWTPETYQIALAVARGEQTIWLDIPAEERELADQYPDSETILAVWIGSLRELFPFLDIRIKGDEAATIDKAATDLAEAMERKAQTYRDQARIVRGHASGEPLHVALTAYSKYITQTHGTSGYGRTQQNLVVLLKSQLENVPLNLVNADKIDTHQAHLANRPLSKYDNKPLAYTTCRNALITHRQFLRWLDRSDKFTWELPRGFSFKRQRIRKTPEDRADKHKRRHFKISELTTIWQYAHPWDRALILLALNAGFSKAEIATLQSAEVKRDKHARTYIKRDRHKTDCYGEWVLWPETVEALAFLKTLHKGGTPYMVTSKTGRPLDRKTPKGNENQSIKNHWDGIMRRIKADDPTFHVLPFKCLRKTGATLVRHLARRRATELASMYLAHGERSDSADSLLPVYTSRPWRKLHKVVLKMRRKLQPMFDAVKEPWEARKTRLSPQTGAKIIAMRAEGKTYEEVAEALKLHWTTVGRYCRQHSEETSGQP